MVLGLDDTIERRRGRHIWARGIYRDPVRSSDSHFVKASGLRWVSLMLLAPIPWAGRIWALPSLTALVPSERACRERDRRHKPLLDVGCQLALQARRWRMHDNSIRPHSSFDYQPPAPEAVIWPAGPSRSAPAARPAIVTRPTMH